MTGAQMTAAVAELERKGVYVQAREDAGVILVDVLATGMTERDTKAVLLRVLAGTTFRISPFQGVTV